MILLRVKKCPWSSTAHFPEEILRGLAASTTLLFLPLPCTPLLSLQSVEDRWAGTYPRPSCFFHPPECRPEGSPGGWEGLQKVRVCSWFWPLRMAFMERRVLTDMFTPQLMGKNKREEGSVEMEDLGSAMCNVATHSSVLAWRIPRTEKPGGLQSMGSQSRTWLKQLSSSSSSICNVKSHHLIVLLLPVCVCLLSHSVSSDSLRPRGL